MSTARFSFARRIALIAAAAAVPMAGFGLAPLANAQTPQPMAPCDPGTSSIIWDGVKNVDPINKGTNRLVVWPNGDQSRGWAVHEGAKPAVDQNLLVVPTVREGGIECANLLDDGAPNYFKHAYDQIGRLPLGNQGQAADWVLAINSADNRGQSQMHIHLTKLDPTARGDIDQAVKQAKVAADEYGWLDAVIDVRGHDDNSQPEKSPRGYRAWNARSIDQNFFDKLNNMIVQPLQRSGKDVGMRNEVLLITKNHQGPGFIVLASDKKSGMTPYGVDNVERLLDKG